MYLPETLCVWASHRNCAQTPTIDTTSGSTIMAQIRAIKIYDALKFPGIFTPLTCFKWNAIWLITPSETLVSGSTIMAQVRDINISEPLKFLSYDSYRSVGNFNVILR